MNKFFYGFFTALSIILIVGCSSTLLKNNEGVFGKSSKKYEKIDDSIRRTENAQAQSNEERLSKIGAWSKGGVEHALDKIPATNVTREVVVAKQMNDRVEALAGKPDFKEVEAIKSIVDDLTSQTKEAIIKGEEALAEKDKEIQKLEVRVKDLNAQREEDIAKAMAQANADARKTDQLTATLTQLDSWGGLGAIWYGIKKLVTRMAWILGIGGGVFLILRLLSASNPIAGAIFNIFEQLGSLVIHTISAILPKALSIAGNVSVKSYNATKSALTSIVDSVETAKLQADGTGKAPTLKDVLNNASMTMTQEQKSVVDNVKTELGWVRPATISTVAYTPSPVLPLSNKLQTATSNETPKTESQVVITPPSSGVIVTSSTPPPTNS